MTVTTSAAHTEAITTEGTPSDDSEPTTAGAEPTLMAEDLLVEDVSIDGMCGVY